MVGGSAMDMASALQRKTARVAHGVIDKAPAVAKAATHKAADMLHDAEVPDALRGAVVEVSDSHMAQNAKTIVGQVAAGLGHRS